MSINKHCFLRFFLYLSGEIKHTINMFKKTEKEQQIDMYSGIPGLLTRQSRKFFDDETAWHNQFRDQVLNRIDEEVFRVLFSDNMGASNASVRLLISMMILKEGMGWSDLQLFEQCRFNLLVRSALGMFNLNDNLPAESTYYLLRKRIHQHLVKHDEDLFEKCFTQVTREHVKEFNVNGKAIRMDSKLIGSNIAYYSRYEIIHKSLTLFIKSLKNKQLRGLSQKATVQVDAMLKEEPQKTIYYSTKDEVAKRMSDLGVLIYNLINTYSSNKSEPYQLLQRVFDEHYQVKEGNKIHLRPKQEITSDSVQSPHDSDCSYRQKGDQKVKGYSVNITETASDKGLNLITHSRVAKANIQDTCFVGSSIVNTKEVTLQKIEKIYADGNYHSPGNTFYTHDIDMVYAGIQGGKPRYLLKITPEGLLVTDTETGESQLAKPVQNAIEERWSIKTSKGYRYFNNKNIQTSKLREQCSARSVEETRKRNNVEATIYHLVCQLRNNKTRYRRLGRQIQWATPRCLWINFIRISNHIRQTHQRTPIRGVLCPKTNFNSYLQLIFSQILLICSKISLNHSVTLKNQYINNLQIPTF